MKFLHLQPLKNQSSCPELVELTKNITHLLSYSISDGGGGGGKLVDLKKKV